jgi:response regulator RpfG family c-di-GMP phosphodiesterase
LHRIEKKLYILFKSPIGITEDIHHMARILVIEDDDTFRGILKDSLSDLNHEVTVAPNAVQAMHYMKERVYDLAISDVQMPRMTGAQLLKWSREHCPIPFILMSGFTHMIDAKEAMKLGARDFLAKPFQSEDLEASIARALGLPAPKSKIEAKKATNNIEYFSVAIGDFVARAKIDFDVFIKLPGDKYVRIGHEGSSLPKEQILKYQEKKITHFYVRKSDFTKLTKFNMQANKVLGQSGNVSEVKRISFLRYTGEVILEKMRLDSVDPESYDQAKDLVEYIINETVENVNCLTLLESLKNQSDVLFARSICASIYVVMLAKKLGINDEKSLHDLSIAALFHEIGFRELSPELIKKKYSSLNAEELKEFQSHTTRGHDLLVDIPNISADVYQLVHQHHEDLIGKGFPRGLVSSEQHANSKILQVICLFSEALIPSEVGDTYKMALDAIASIEENYDQRVDTQILGALKSLFYKPANTI